MNKHPGLLVCYTRIQNYSSKKSYILVYSLIMSSSMKYINNLPQVTLYGLRSLYMYSLVTLLQSNPTFH